MASSPAGDIENTLHFVVKSEAVRAIVTSPAACAANLGGRQMTSDLKRSLRRALIEERQKLKGAVGVLQDSEDATKAD